jgi:proteasome accessory factor B
VPHLDASDPSLPALLDAARQARPVRFDYRKPADPAPQRRSLEPWGVLSWRGRWYVAGHDRDRGEPRSFRLSRITGKVEPFGTPGEFSRPEHVSLLDLVSGRAEDTHVARIAVSGSGAGELRRLAESQADGVLSVRFNDVGWLARRVASAGASAHVLEPAELAAAVVARLTAAVGAAS